MAAEAVRLNQSITAAATVSELLSITTRAQQQMNVVNCATSLQRLAKLAAEGSISAPSAAHITSRAAHCFGHGAAGVQARHVAGVLWACAKLRLAPPELLRAVFESGERMRAEWFKPVEISMAIWAVGRLAEAAAAGGGALVGRLLPLALEREHLVDAQGWSNIAGGLSHMRPAPPHAQLRPLLAVVTRRMAEFSAQEVANVLSALARLRVRLDGGDGGGADFAAAAARAVRGVREKFSAQQLANCAWAVARLAEAAPPAARSALDFWALLADELGRRAFSLNAQELSMCSWAAAQAVGGVACGRPPAALCAALCAAARSLALQMDAQQLATVALALVKLGAAERETLRQLARASRRRMLEFGPQDLDNLASAYARLAAWRAPKLVASIATAGCELLLSANGAARAPADGEAFPPRNLVNLLWAVVKMNAACLGSLKGGKQRRGARKTAALADAVSASLLGRVDELNARDLSNAAWALATLGPVEAARRDCMRRMGARSAQILDTFNAQECSKLLYAFGKARVKCPELHRAAAEPRDLLFDFVTGPVKLRAILGGARFGAGREATNATAGTGGALWEDAYVLAEWLSRQPSPSHAAVALETHALATKGTWGGLTAVELGAGLGLCSIVAHQLGMSVTATDGYEDVLHLLKENVSACVQTSASPLHVRSLRWGTPDPIEQLGLSAAPDVLIATGCVYGSDPRVFEDLVQTMDALSGPHTLVLMCHGNGAAPGVHELDGPFYSLASQYFDSFRISQYTLHPDHQGCQIHCLRKRCSTKKVIVPKRRKLN
ncbi:hypothetical protein AB1Y20_005466 [Prymnesium parvum]|uniref:Calmodulin-lysine N-methyltransferase n=1 Tax=Prymnesium parvum TaxID=97485 RepID=A0AB34J4B5_PRYPA